MEAGTLLLEKYRVERLLGCGGMGKVVVAHHVDLNERVAIKFLLPELAKSEEVVGRFIREAQAAVRIRSEHVVQVRDVGRMPTGEPYMVMELLQGEDLSGRIERGMLAVSEMVDLMIEACEALALAHAQGIVHRDLKPANLFLSEGADGVVLKLLDFGISKFSTQGAASLTQNQTMMGSPMYMPPEQLNSAKDVDERADIWALGVIMYECLTARPPFTGELLAQLVVNILSGQPAPIGNYRTDVPPQLERVVAWCLAKDRAHRCPSVLALAQALAPFATAKSTRWIERMQRIPARAAGPSSSLSPSQVEPARLSGPPHHGSWPSDSAPGAFQPSSHPEPAPSPGWSGQSNAHVSSASGTVSWQQTGATSSHPAGSGPAPVAVTQAGMSATVSGAKAGRKNRVVLVALACLLAGGAVGVVGWLFRARDPGEAERASTHSAAALPVVASAPSLDPDNLRSPTSIPSAPPSATMAMPVPAVSSPGDQPRGGAAAPSAKTATSLTSADAARPKTPTGLHPIRPVPSGAAKPRSNDDPFAGERF